MSKTNERSLPIVVVGATGYTGKLVVEELHKRRLAFAIAGRNEEKLMALKQSIGNEVLGTIVLDVANSASLNDLCARTGVIINCAGPFLDMGEAVVRAAIEHGCHYLDTTGEQLFMKKMVDLHASAEKAGVAVVNAMAFEYALGDMGAALAAEGFEKIDAIEIHYALQGMHTSQGTKRSAIRIFQNDTFGFESGSWVVIDPGKNHGSFDFPPPMGTVSGINFPGGEIITLPRHTPARNVRVYMGAPKTVGKTIQMFSPTLFKLARSKIADLAKAFIDKGPEGPTPDERIGDIFNIGIDVFGTQRGLSLRQQLLIAGTDPYGITAVIAVQAALIMLSPTFFGRGVLPPAVAFQPRSFLDGLKTFGISWQKR